MAETRRKEEVTTMSITTFIKLKWLELLAKFEDKSGQVPEEPEEFTFL